MAVVATLLSYSDWDHIVMMFRQIVSLVLHFVARPHFAGRIDPTEEILSACSACRLDCVRLDASWAFRAGSECVAP